ncbi:MAG: NfeD family protein, partial [Thermodesulfobacteriota bacterium]
DTSLAAAHADSSEVARVRVGDRGRAATTLRPAGKMQLGHDLIDVVSEGELVAPGTPVAVLRIDGNRIIVRPERP